MQVSHGRVVAPARALSRMLNTRSDYTGSHVITLIALVLASACASDDEPPEFARRPRDTTDRQPSTDPADRCPSFDSEYRDRFKACEIDEDCAAVEVYTRCNQRRIYATATGEQEAFLKCAPKRPGTCTAEDMPTRAEDGRTTFEDLSNVHVRCLEGMCRSRVEERACGATDQTCGVGELCVSLMGTDGELEFVCTENPCEGESLACECAEPVCESEDRLRTCAIDQVIDSDVYCKNVQR